jgi:hypothetical protein
VSDTAGDDLILDCDRFGVYLDGGLAAWPQAVSRPFYLLTHPATLRRLRGLRRGPAPASEQAAQLVYAMVQP